MWKAGRIAFLYDDLDVNHDAEDEADGSSAPEAGLDVGGVGIGAASEVTPYRHRANGIKVASLAVEEGVRAIEPDLAVGLPAEDSRLGKVA